MYELAIAVRCLASPPFDSRLQENVMAIRLSIGCGRPILQLPSKRLSLRKPTHAPYAGDVFAIAVRCLASPPFDSRLQENVMAIRAFYSQR